MNQQTKKKKFFINSLGSEESLLAFNHQQNNRGYTRICAAAFCTLSYTRNEKDEKKTTRIHTRWHELSV